MTRNQKLLAGLVALVVVLFVVALGTSSDGEGDPNARPGGLVGLLGNWFGDAASADAADLSGDCLRPGGRLEVDGSCVLTVAPSDEDVRVVKLHAESATEVSAPSVRGDTTVTTDLDAGEDASVTVGPDGADITLTCPKACVLTLGKEK
jgi:hypothetical protein